MVANRREKTRICRARLPLDAATGATYDAQTLGTNRVDLRGVNNVAEGYCVKCKAKKEMVQTQEVTMKNGRPALKGVCPDCGTKIMRILGGKKEG